MGFLSKAFDVLVELCEDFAKKIDQMSDSEIEEKFVSKNQDKDVQYFRDFSERAKQLSERRKIDDDLRNNRR